ncbi:hypothetical protein JVU11DRAFT_4030 [Chiua virens]|nr:hypothetical protein JVU11DRAFT_4030 [Chiua virens]
MLRAVLLSLVATAVGPAFATRNQVPLHQWRHPLDEDLSEWSLDVLPNPNATDHLVFETVHSLLQHWPNTRMRNGHNIVPGIVPKGTVLYHGTDRNELPPGPEWVATDPEHSHLFCREKRNYDARQGCWQLSLATTRPLKVVYFDGSSAVKLPYGSLDTQDLIAWGKSDSDNPFDDWTRIVDLCEWGKNFSVDGFVRMEMDFEIMLCDFTSGVSEVSFSYLARQSGGQRKLLESLFEVMNSGSWHNHLPGETRIQLDLTALVSFYDTQLVSSLVPIRAGQERWDHRVANISSEDLSAVKSRLEKLLAGPPDPSSGIDWQTLVQVIVDRYAQRLELIHYLLNTSVTDPSTMVDLANKTQTQLRIILTPHLLFSATPTDPSNGEDLDWTAPIYKICATTHTRLMDLEMGSMTNSEKLLLQAVRGTTREICRVVTKMWAAGVHAGIDPLLNPRDSIDIVEITQVWNSWGRDLDRLMAWLDWNVWVKCSPECNPDEMCYLPTWPVGFPRIGRPGRGPGGPGEKPPPPPSGPQGPHPERPSSFDLRVMLMESLAGEMETHIMAAEPDDWIRPQPRCVRRIEPYDIL